MGNTLKNNEIESNLQFDDFITSSRVLVNGIKAHYKVKRHSNEVYVKFEYFDNFKLERIDVSEDDIEGISVENYESPRLNVINEYARYDKDILMLVSFEDLVLTSFEYNSLKKKRLYNNLFTRFFKYKYKRNLSKNIYTLALTRHFSSEGLSVRDTRSYYFKFTKSEEKEKNIIETEWFQLLEDEKLYNQFLFDSNKNI